MEQLYKVDGSRYGAFLGDINDTLLNHCKKDEFIRRSRNNFRFKVSGGKESVPCLKAEGGIGDYKFEFLSGADGASFSCEAYDDAEEMFCNFAMSLNFYRKSMRLPELDFAAVYDMVETDSPPLTAGSYAPFTGAHALDKLLGKKFDGVALREIMGKLGVIVYSENARITECFYKKSIPVYQKFLDDFSRLYGFDGAMLVCVRGGGSQHVFFHVKRKGLFVNTEDGSGNFLKNNRSRLKTMLSGVPEAVIRCEKSPPPNYISEYRKTENANGYTLYVGGKATEMCIYRVQLGSDSIPVDGVPMPLCWFAEGGQEEAVRPYKTLNDAFAGEAALLSRIMAAGNLSTIMYPEDRVTR